MSNVLMLLKCNGLAYDDRVRKECISLNNVGISTDIVVVQDDNNKSHGKIYTDNTNYWSIRLLSRSLFSGNRFLLLKLFELFFHIFPQTIKRRDAVWLHDPLMFVFIPYFFLLKKLGRINLIIWDQHELPPQNFLHNSLLKRVYIQALKLADVRIHANEERAKYLNKVLNHDFDFEVIRNFVDITFSNEKSQEISHECSQWLGESQFILLQSGGYKVRCFDHVAESICNSVRYKCVVVGGYDKKYIEQLRSKYSNFDELFFFTGMIPQSRLVDYIDKATVSLILYDSSSVNAKYCEPNRLYYSIVRNTPVIVGNNPTMANIVNSCNAGVVLNDDGTNATNITDGINTFLSIDKETFSFHFPCTWESQSSLFETIKSRLS